MGLWQILEDGEDVQFTADVKYLVEDAAGKLLLVRETFPDYTLHDRQHADNVIKLVEQLLGPDVGKLTQLEAGMLVLAAYFHDIGMVYTREEVDALLEEQDFRDYLDQHPTAYVRVAQEGKPPEDVILDYCRARHAERVSEHLYRLDPDRLAWRGLNLAKALATVCKSHNEPLEELRAERFDTDFLTGCDLRLCALLLRAADLLDFDQSRSPVAVYEHLRLGEAVGSRRISQAEWAKHMASIGFVFPQERAPGYSVKLIATPRQPAVENAIRKFLEVVEDELRGCRVVLDFCAPRWRTLAMPGSVDRSGIESQGYRWGDYRFVLDRDAILHLFMGDRLYANPYVFIRELLQNAIDACRLNAYLHDLEPDEMEVRISAWEDREGNYWLRVDDNGVGMDQHIIEKYFLGVGRSYYSSDELRAEILRKQKPQRNFVPISRFGVGVLSTFIVGDRIEVSTRRRLPDGRLAAPIRLSLHSLDDFFVFREPPMPIEEFPARTDDEQGYRKISGTSVAVRINPAKSDVALGELLQYARSSLFYPPGRIYINDVEYGEQKFSDLAEPLFEGPVSFVVPYLVDDDEVDAEILESVEVTLTAFPLDLTANSPSTHIRGQLVAVLASAEPREGGADNLLAVLPKRITQNLSPGLLARVEGYSVGRYVSAKLRGVGSIDVSLRMECDREILIQVRKEIGELPGCLYDFTRIFGEVHMGDEHFDSYVNFEAELSISMSEVIGVAASGRLSQDWLGHNGICVSTALDRNRPTFSGKLTLAEGFLAGSICLYDDLRPDVSVSRDSIREISFKVRSAIQLALRRAAAQYLDYADGYEARQIMGSQILLGLPMGEISEGDINSDPLAAEWYKEELVGLSSSSMVSVDHLRGAVKVAPVELSIRGVLWSESLDSNFPLSRPSFNSVIALSALEREFDIELIDVDSNSYANIYKILLSPTMHPRLSGSALFPPFSAIRYETADIVIKPQYPANLRNPLVEWFFGNALELSGEYPALFVQFRRALAAIASRRRSLLGGYESGAELMNVTMDRIRRSFSNLPPALYQDVRLGDGNVLKQDL